MDERASAPRTPPIVAQLSVEELTLYGYLYSGSLLLGLI